MKSLYYLSWSLLCSFIVNAIVLDVDNLDSIRNAAALVAHGTQDLYTGNRTGGSLGKWPFPPYYWWESGGAWGSMMQYQLFTGDTSYDNVMYEGVCSQLGPNYDFVMADEATNTGNDDQAFWALIAMTAAENNYTAPPAPAPGWLRVAQNVFEEYVQRWDTSHCAGGLKWQFDPKYNGFHYKQTIANGAFFQISARLARYTGNQTYLEWAEKVWDWTQGVGLITQHYHVYDGSDELINCTVLDSHEWSYNAGVFLYGAAVLRNFTNSSLWDERATGILDTSTRFFSPFANASNIIYETECETNNPMNCTTDQQSMKAYLIRWLANTSQVMPSAAGRIGILLRATAAGAAASCTGGAYGNSCGTRWYVNGYDGNTGLGPEMSALEAITALLVNQTAPPGTMPGVKLPLENPPPSSSSLMSSLPFLTEPVSGTD